MKKSFRFLSLLVFILSGNLYSSNAQIQGIVVADTNNLTIIKLWGTHQERGFAYGYLLGTEISTVFKQYLLPQFGSYYGQARYLITNPQNFSIDSIYQSEAKAIVSGMDSAGKNTYSMDYIDLLVCNSFLDVSKLMSKNAGMGCSSLISWGDATAGTDLDGKAAITRHLDWSVNANLTNNQILYIHLPSEENEQAWAGIGFAGMFGVLSGFNRTSGVFQHMMDDFSGNAQIGMQYEPIWISLRKSIEQKDYNGDQQNNTQDLLAIMQENSNGYADGFIISCLSENSQEIDSLTAMIVETAPQPPYLTHRYSSFADSIPGDNLYTANYQIARDSLLHFCTRYNGMRGAIGNGENISLDAQYNLMRDFSHLPLNLQIMQFSPQSDLFRISCYRSGTAAYLQDPSSFSIENLFSDPLSITNFNSLDILLTISPNPVSEMLKIQVKNSSEIIHFSIYSAEGKHIQTGKQKLNGDFLEIPVADLPAGMYLLKLHNQNKFASKKFIKK